LNKKLGRRLNSFILLQYSGSTQMVDAHALHGVRAFWGHSRPRIQAAGPYVLMPHAVEHHIYL
jgi:hypothetical protein